MSDTQKPTATPDDTFDGKSRDEFFNPFASEDVGEPFSDHWEAKRRVAQAIRDLTDVLITSTPPTEQLNEIADALEQQAATFAENPRLYGLRAFVADGNHGGHGEINHELNAVGGWSNPLSPGMNMWIEGERAYGSVRCGYAYEGPPGHVHGGFVAAILDQFLGMAQLAGGLPGMTGSLEVRYLKPTPLNTDLALEASIEPAGGRKTRVKGTIKVGDTVTATGEGLFIRPKNPIARPYS
jgi:hypothetical protein